jgi:hypothetical protein
MVQAGERTGNAPLLPPFIAAAALPVPRGRDRCARRRPAIALPYQRTGALCLPSLPAETLELLSQWLPIGSIPTPFCVLLVTQRLLKGTVREIL